MEQEPLSHILALLHLSRSRCFWEIGQTGYRDKESSFWLFKPLMSALPVLEERVLDCKQKHKLNSHSKVGVEQK